MAAAAAGAEPRFKVSGTGRAGPDGLRVALAVSNLLADPVSRVVLVGELAGERAEARLEQLAPAKEESFELRFALSAPLRAGVHALTLLIDFQPQQPGAPRRGERLAVLLPLGAEPPPAVAVQASPLALDLLATLELRISSRDGAAHRVALEVIPPHGVNVREAPAQVAVPALGAARVPVRLVRGGAERGRRQPILIVTRPLDGALERASLASVELELLPEPAVLPRLRPALGAAAAALLAAAGALEWLRRRA